MPYLLFLWLFVLCSLCLFFFFFFNDTATTEIYTLSHTTLFRSLGLVINGVAALVLAALAARGVAEGSAEHRALRSEEHTSELQSQSNLVCRLLLEKKKKPITFSAATI